MCEPEWEEHDNYTPSEETWEEVLEHKIVIWRKWYCECELRVTDVKSGEREK